VQYLNRGVSAAESWSIYTEQCLYRQDNRYSSFFCKEWFYLYQKFRQMFS